MSNHVLKQDSKSLQGLMSRLDELQRLNTLLGEHLEVEIAKHCQVVKFEKNCLFVIVDNGSWATQLRFQIPELMTKLRQIPKMENLSGIICKTRPHPSVKSDKQKKRQVTTLSQPISEQVLEIANTIQDEKLREILTKIARRKS